MNYLALFIVCLLVIASFVVYFQIHHHATAERLNNQKRLIAWWIIFAVCLLAFYLGIIGITALLVGLLLWVSIELSDLFDINNKTRFICVANVITAMLVCAVFLWPELSHYLFFASLLFALIVYCSSIPSLYFTALLYGFCVSSLLSLLVMALWFQRESMDYAYLLLILFFITAVNDIAQYITGHCFGRTAISPTLSPNKTLEGVLGGMIMTALISSLLMPTAFSITWDNALAMGGLLSLAGFLGDLNISRVKRAINIKDSGSSIMGHGGLLDRIDSLLLIAPIFGVLMFLGSYVSR